MTWDDNNKLNKSNGTNTQSKQINLVLLQTKTTFTQTKQYTIQTQYSHWRGNNTHTDADTHVVWSFISCRRFSVFGVLFVCVFFVCVIWVSFLLVSLRCRSVVSLCLCCVSRVVFVLLNVVDAQIQRTNDKWTNELCTITNAWERTTQCTRSCWTRQRTNERTSKAVTEKRHKKIQTSTNNMCDTSNCQIQTCTSKHKKWIRQVFSFN